MGEKLVMSRLLFFPKDRQESLSQKLGSDLGGVWQVKAVSKLETRDPLYTIERMIHSNPKSKLGQKLQMRMSDILENAKQSSFRKECKPVEVAEHSPVEAGYVRFKNPNSYVGCSGRFSSPFGIFSMESLKSDGRYCKFVRVASWHGMLSEYEVERLKKRNETSENINQIEAPRLGEEVDEVKQIAGFVMERVDMDEIGW